MWNHIRGPPFVHSSQSGGVAYIHGSSQAQFVLETYFVMGMYGLIVIGVVLLCEAGDEKNDPGVSFFQRCGTVTIFYGNGSDF
jgi:oligosaccharyltransferase complex subunit gamma